MAKKKMTLEEKLEEAIVKDAPYEVPGFWVWTNIGSILRVSSGKGLTTKEMNAEGNIPVYGGNGITGCHDEAIYDAGKLIIGRVGAQCGNVHITASPCWITDNALVVEYQKKMINNKYLYYALKELNLGSYSTSSAQPVISGAKIYSIPIAIPPLKEQQRIVDKIESLFEKLDKAKELIEEARDDFEKRKASILEKAFRGELTKEWRKDNNFKLEKWQEKLLSETNIQIIDGDRGKNYPKKDEFEDEGYCLFLNAKNVTKEGFRFDELNFISKEKDEVLRKGKLERFDIVLTTRGTIGNIAYYDENISYENVRINSGMVIYRGGNEFHKPFLCRMYQSKYIIDQIDKMKTGTAQPQLPIKIMRNLKIIIPSLDEQKEIVRILDKLLCEESKIEELTRLEGQIELIKKSILAKAFRGQLGTNCEEDESALELLKEILSK